MSITEIVIAILICTSGTLSQYAKSPTDQVLYNRSIPGHTAYTLPEDRSGVDGYIAVADCSQIGKTVTVIWQGRIERLMVFDCAGDNGTRQWMRRGRIIGEIDYYTAARWGILGRGASSAMMCQGLLAQPNPVADPLLPPSK